MESLFYQIRHFPFKLHKIEYKVENEKLKIADSIRWPFLTEFDALHSDGRFLSQKVHFSILYCLLTNLV